jgi:hypothetical protein
VVIFGARASNGTIEVSEVQTESSQRSECQLHNYYNGQ